MASMTPSVYVVDDDPGVRDALAIQIGTQGLHVLTFDSATSFLQTYTPGDIGCLVLDIRMPDINGLALQDILSIKENRLPIIFITGHGDLEQCTRAFRGGAVDFITKPIDRNRLLESLRKAIRSSIQLQQHEAETAEVKQQLEKVTEREMVILRLVADGLSSKEIAKELDVSPRTIEAHRANLFNKLGVNSLAELIRFYLKALPITGNESITHPS